MNWRRAVLVYAVCSVVVAGYLFMQIPSPGVSGCVPSAEDLQRERMEGLTSPAFLGLGVLAVLNMGLLIWVRRS
jgi:hypothetical protein